MTTRERLHEPIERLTGEQLTKVQAILDQVGEDPRIRWRNIPGLSLPDRWPPDYGSFNPVKIDGEPVSEQLLRDRR